MTDLFKANITEDAYLKSLREQNYWSITDAELAQIIRQNFHRRVPGTHDLLSALLRKYRLVLLSDHAVEWIAYIKTVHPFLAAFERRFFSFDLKQTKQEPSTFLRVLASIQRDPADCVFVDDSERNVTTAASVGITGVQFSSAAQLAREFGRLEIEV